MNRERLTILRDHLASLPDERVDMRYYYSANGEPIANEDEGKEGLDEWCGTAACIAGWASYLFDSRPECADEALGLKRRQESLLFHPQGYLETARYSRRDAIAAIQSMLDNPDDDALPVWPGAVS